ncbi:hypothetical protein CVT25_010395 [Psilocybe cyanescens]|uniref:Fungal lipase-type domain-containing protein n=1 Tax=Psilocybe cyanescens TaxID=93625 RepID=A0A409XP29_PSICY|nr:hypothetical protein CVT25_010395 [Psilocybe cyanescens]
MGLYTTVLLFSFCILYVVATPASYEILPRQSTIISPLTKAQISAFKPFTHFAGAAYCNPSKTAQWNCGATCAANKDFKPIASGGDGSAVQFWYVGYSPSQATVIVGHQGTNISDIEADLTDLLIAMEPLSPTLFPGVDSAIRVHSGFANEQAKTATRILQAVKSAISAYKAKKVTLIGHSLGAALALLDGIYLPLHISGVTFRVIGYGMPRIGNQNFANYVDNHLKNLTRINNKKDPVPILPGKFLGFHHPSGEVHIIEQNQWLTCPGQDNPNTQCSTGDVPSIFEGNVANHHGPYDGVSMDC